MQDKRKHENKYAASYSGSACGCARSRSRTGGASPLRGTLLSQECGTHDSKMSVADFVSHLNRFTTPLCKLYHDFVQVKDGQCEHVELARDRTYNFCLRRASQPMGTAEFEYPNDTEAKVSTGGKETHLNTSQPQQRAYEYCRTLCSMLCLTCRLTSLSCALCFNSRPLYVSKLSHRLPTGIVVIFTRVGAAVRALFLRTVDCSRIAKMFQIYNRASFCSEFCHSVSLYAPLFFRYRFGNFPPW